MNFEKPYINETMLSKIVACFFPLTNYEFCRLFGIPNNTFRVYNDEIDVVFKIYSIGQSSYSHIESEIEIITKLYSEGLKTLQLVKALNGQYLVKINKYYVCCSQYIVGITLDKITLSKANYFSIGKLIGNFKNHNQKISLKKYQDVDNIMKRYNYVLNNINNIITSKNLSYILDYINKEITICEEYLLYLNDNYKSSLLHMDIWQYNIILSNDDYYLIDFDDWVVGPDIFELAVSCLELGFINGKLEVGNMHHIINGMNDSIDILAIYYIDDLIKAMKVLCVLWFGYNIIQSENLKDALVYIDRLKIRKRQTEDTYQTHPTHEIMPLRRNITCVMKENGNPEY